MSDETGSDIQKWIDKCNKKRKKKGNYLHFDFPLSPENATTFVTSPEEVLRHSFYPMIRRIKREPRYKKDTEGKHYQDTKERHLYKTAHADSAIFSWYGYRLEKRYETEIKKSGLNDVVLAYRSSLGKATYDFANEAFEFIKISKESLVAIAYDVESFFDKIDHASLLKKCEELLERVLTDDELFVLEKVMTYCYVEQEKLTVISNLTKDGRLCTPKEFRSNIADKKLIHKQEEVFGVAQGTPISAILSNIYLLEFDKAINDLAKRKGALYLRYSDDILLICKPADRETFEKLVTAKILSAKLNIQTEKATVVTFLDASDGKLICLGQNGDKASLQYLGLEFDGQKISIRSKTLARYFRRLKRDAHKHKNMEVKLKRKVSRSKLFKKHTHLGKRNFLNYSSRIAKATNDNTSKKQLKRHIEILEQELNE